MKSLQINKKHVDSFQIISILNKLLQFYSYEIDGVYGPPTLYGASLVSMGSKLYLYGGKCASINSGLYEFNNDLKIWKKME